MSSRFPLVCALVAAAAVLGGCAADYHYSQLYGTRYHVAAMDTYPVVVSKIDGKSTPLAGPVLAEPGPHLVAVTAADRVHTFPVERSLQLQVEPCTRYYLVAVKTSPLASEFTVKVDYEEPVAGCSAPKAG
jgi:hypothetical protein